MVQVKGITTKGLISGSDRNDSYYILQHVIQRFMARVHQREGLKISEDLS